MNTRIAWFYLREARGGMNPSKNFLEMHRIGCVAMFKLNDGKLAISFSLATKGDRFCRKVGRDIALGKLCCASERRITVIDTPKDSADLIRQYPALYKALVRRVGTTLMSEKNDSALAGALKELELAKAA
jgi:hypothetical protein